jgi:hypothetical protein
MTFSIEQIIPAGIGAASLVLLASSPAPAQRCPDVAPAWYVDGASTCAERTGKRDCPLGGLLGGPFRKVGEGEKNSPGSTLCIRAGSYTEPVILSKIRRIEAYEGPVTIVGPSPLAPFDLVADTVDDNGLPLNPRWGGQQKTGSGWAPAPVPGQCTRSVHQCISPGPAHIIHHDPGILPCSHQYTYYNCPDFVSARWCEPHVNWFGVTYSTPSQSDASAPTQKIEWEAQTCQPDDYDYNMNLQRDDQAGYAEGEEGRLHMEFDFRETINHFTTPWWSQFHKAVENDHCATHGSGGGQIDGSAAIVTALMGFDASHPSPSGALGVELHPVWALAMNVNSQGSTDDDTWVFFVRNWGNEGSCGASQEFIYFPNNQYTFRLPWNLPWRAGATSATVIPNFEGYNTQGPPPSVENGAIRIVPGVGIFVTFPLDAPREDGSVWNGELHVQWIGGPWGGGRGGGACCPSGTSCCGGCENGTCTGGCIAAGQHCR